MLFAACTKEMQETEVPVAPGEEPVVTYLTVSLDPDTRTHMDPAADGDGAHKVYWSNGDQIAVNGVVSRALTDVAENAQTAVFAFDDELTTPYHILYPASAYEDATHITLPGLQDYAAGGFAEGMFPMAGVANPGESITLTHLCSMLKIQVKRASGSGANTNKLVSVKFKGNADEQVSGSFAIDYDNHTLTGASSADADKEVKVVKKQTTSTSTPVVYYLVVPSGSYDDGFEVAVKDEKGNLMTKSTGTAKDYAAGHIYPMKAFDFVPTTMDEGIAIESAQDLIDFATDYNDKSARTHGLGDDVLVVTLKNNITFTSEESAAFNAIGGIGTPYGGNNYFKGIFNGNNMTISGLESTCPLFNGIDETAVVKDFTVDDSCSFTFTHPNTNESLFGAIAGYHKGVLDNVKVAADVSLAAVSDVTQQLSLGGLVARATVGTLNACEYSGLISTPAGYSASEAKLIIGGLVARFSNAGSITNSYFKGAISNAAQVSSTSTSTPYLVIGGVVGYLDGKATVSSSQTTADHADEASAYSGFNGEIVNKTIVAYNSAVGGIVGEVNDGTISSCTNAAHIALSIFKDGGAGATGNTNARYMKTGGIVGKVNANGSVTGCTNNGAVEHRSNPRLQDIGGIAGYNAGTITECTNNAAVNHMTTGISGATNKGGRVVNIAGVIGENASVATVSDVHNTANIQISAMEDNYDTEGDKPVCEARMGGVIAYNEAAIDGGSSTKNITNSGQVYFNSYFSNQFIGYELGGIVGYSKGSVQNAKNSGYVVLRWNSDANVASKVYLGGIVGMMAGNGTIGGCINEGGASNAGEVYPNVKAGSAGHNNIFAGGILGWSESNVTISGCTNSGFVHGGNTTRVNGTSFYVGGIVAYLKGASQILDCTNTGNVTNAHNNNTDTIGSTPLTGGIAGHVEGTDANPIVIGGTTGCSVDAAFSVTRGWVAGVVAYAKYVNLSNCSVEQDINVAARAIGGLVGKAEYCNISASTVNSSKVHANNVQAATGQGGIVGNLSNSTVDGCSCYTTTLTNNVSIATVGTIAGVSGSNNTIQNCHYKATVTTTAGSVASSIVGTGSFTDGGGNEADL